MLISVFSLVKLKLHLNKFVCLIFLHVDRSIYHRTSTMPAAINLTFGNAVEATVIFSTGSSVTLMDVEFYEKIKALPNAEEIIRSEGKSEFNYWSGIVRTPQKIIAAVSLNTDLSGVPVVIRFHLVKGLIADGILGVDSIRSLSLSVTFMGGGNGSYFERRHGSRIVRTNFLENPKLKNEKEGDEKRIIVATVTAYV